MDTTAFDRYPIVITKSKDNVFHAKAVDFEACEESGEILHEVIEEITTRIESISWDLSASNLEVPKPSTFDDVPIEKRKQTIYFVDVVKRYSSIPEILYLYYPINEHLLPMLLKPYFYFSDPSKYNDPFERPDVFYEDWTEKELLREVKWYVSYKGYPISDFNSFYIKSRIQNSEEIEKLVETKKKVLDKIASQYEMACFSRRFDNTLMWSHYTNKHEGIVIGYDYSSLNIEEKGVDGSDIDYRRHKDKLRTGDFAGDPTAKDYPRAWITRKLFTKHPEWSYEQEFRLKRLVDRKNKEEHSPILHIPKESITEVYFGCKMNDDTKKFISHILNGRSINLYEMYIENSSLRHKEYA